MTKEQMIKRLIEKATRLNPLSDYDYAMRKSYDEVASIYYKYLNDNDDRSINTYVNQLVA